MLVLQLVPVILSLVALGAHFLRRGDTLVVVVVLALIGMMAVPRLWAARAVQIALVLGALEWLRTLVSLASIRAQHGLPATRLVLVLGAVALLTFASVWIFRTQRARSWYRLGSRSDAAGS